jgi:hypothetical protein
MKTNLATAILNSQHAKKVLRDTWHSSKFRGRLIDNLRSKKPFAEPPSDEYPRLRMYRGTGPRMELTLAVKCRCGVCPADSYHLQIETDYVRRDVTSFDEVEGCPGAPVKSVKHFFSVPGAVLTNPTQKAFDDWASEVRLKDYELEQAEADVMVSRLIEKFNLPYRQATASSKKR